MKAQRISRRTMLRGVGVSVALPWLESLSVWGSETGPGRAADSAPVRTRRAVRRQRVPFA